MSVAATVKATSSKRQSRNATAAASLSYLKHAAVWSPVLKGVIGKERRGAVSEAGL